jgi:serine/threonine protein kinase
MPASLDCPSPERWQTLLADNLGADEEERCEQHLRLCPACQELLARIGDPGDALLGLARQMGDPTGAPADPTVAEIVDRLCEGQGPGRLSSAERPALEYLLPANRPGLLGILGKYEVAEVIGQGGMGVVLKAFDPDLHRRVAIKVLSPALACSRTARRRFTREARAAAAVRHEHVVAVHGVHETEGLPYLVMEYVAGESLQHRLDRAGPLEVEEVVRIGMQAASGLAAAHAQGLIHRDVKPANLLLENGLARVKITDFGLARAVDDVGLTQSGVVAGTPEYMAPEQARGEPVDHRADLFALGAVLYACCTGRPPFEGPTVLAVLGQVTDEEPVAIRLLNPGVPVWLEPLVGRLMAKDPAQRLQTAAEVAGLLEGYLTHLRRPATVPAPGLPTSPGQSSRRAGRRRRWPWVVAALVLLPLLGLAGAALLRDDLPADQAPKPGPEPRTEYPETFHPALKGNAGEIPGLVTFGPDAADCVRLEPDGLRITLPPTWPRQRPGTGVATDFGVKGDFEITVTFEVLRDARGGGWGNPTQLRLVVVPSEHPRPGVWQKASQNRALLCREAPGRGNVGGFLVDATSWHPEDITRDPWGNEIFTNIERHALTQAPAEASAGRLRLVRRGSTLSFFTSDGPDGDFTLLHTQDFGTEDLKNVRILASTGGPGVSFDAVVNDVSIRAEGFPRGVAATMLRPAGTGGQWWLVPVLALVGVSAAVAVSFGAWHYRRTRRRAAPAGPVASAVAAATIGFACGGCGKRLRARMDLAGKKLKCPQCGKGVVVPGATPENPEEQP